jgi:precorrin-4/cobalt-precorrin-4 C11-methyltransferase
VSWPDERVVRGTLATIVSLFQAAPVERTALILVGPVLGSHTFRESALYNPDYQRRFRPDRRLERGE